jgi:hypothetical protein
VTLSALLLIAALHPVQMDIHVPKPSINVEGIKAAAAEAGKIEAESGVLVESPVFQQIQACHSLDTLDTDTSTLCLEGLKSRLKYERDFYASQSGDILFRKDAFEWQLFSSRIVFALVLLVVFAGLGFSTLQFYMDFRTKTTGPATASSLQLSKDGITVSSPVLGVIILVVSITFLYLYLQFVYPIHEL